METEKSFNYLIKLLRDTTRNNKKLIRHLNEEIGNKDFFYNKLQDALKEIEDLEEKLKSKKTA